MTPLRTLSAALGQRCEEAILDPIGALYNSDLPLSLESLTQIRKREVGDRGFTTAGGREK